VSIARANPGYRRLEIARIARWLNQYATGARSVGGALPDCAVVIPARATISRVIMHVAVSGITTSTISNYQETQGAYFDNLLTVKDGFHADHVLHKAYDIVPGSFGALFDSTQVPPPVGQNRLFYVLYQGGDRELGCNLKVAWGGPLYTLPMTVSAACGVFKLGSVSGAGFTYGYTMGIRVLYYS
jgi:hypothetical protein